MQLSIDKTVKEKKNVYKIKTTIEGEQIFRSKSSAQNHQTKRSYRDSFMYR